MKKSLVVGLCFLLAGCGGLSRFLPEGTLEVGSAVICGAGAAAVAPEPATVAAAAGACGAAAIALTPSNSVADVRNEHQASVQKARDWQQFLIYGGIVASLLFFIVIPFLQRKFNIKEVEKARMESRPEDAQQINELLAMVARMREDK
ncbi:hypothetical protein N9N32_00105 [Alphaproteobacteria bacterium]|nr:hypothetical protein [Alphaproteobacteria bacterium]